jgi:hypothetical protein
MLDCLFRLRSERQARGEPGPTGAAPAQPCSKARAALRAVLAVVALSVTTAAVARDMLELRIDLEATSVLAGVPGHCMVSVGPGTADAVCDPDGSSDASRVIPTVAGLYFELTAHRSVVGQTTLELAQAYTFADFQKELPGAVCNEERLSRVRIEQPQRQMLDASVIYSATVTCPEVKFLSLAPRRALVRYILADGIRINAMARTLTDNFERTRPLLESFQASVRQQQPEK